MFIYIHYNVEACPDHLSEYNDGYSLKREAEACILFFSLQGMLKNKFKMTSCQFWLGVPNSYFIN